MWRLLAILMLVPGVITARTWRLQLSGGGVTSVNLSNHQVNFANFRHSAPGDMSPFDAMGGVALMRSDSSLEYGLGIQVLPFHFKSPVDVNGTGYAHRAYLGKPAVPVTAIVNFGPNRLKSHAYVGVNAGLVYASGRVTENFEQIDFMSEYTLYYNSGLGYTFGVQAGYRRSFRRVALGFQLQSNFVRLSLKHGTREERFDFNLIYFPAQLYISYRI